MSAKPTTDNEALAILGVADFAFFWDDTEMWGAANPVFMFNLRKGIAGHPAGSTVSRETILACLRAAEARVRVSSLTAADYGRKARKTADGRPCYASTPISERDRTVLEAVESPGGVR